MADSAIWLFAQAPERMDTINIAVVGSLGVGKSSFIQRALRLNKLPTSSQSSVRQDIEGIPHIVCLVEYDTGQINMDELPAPGKQIQWPKQINGHSVRAPDGALVLYDVTDKDSIRDMTPALSEPQTFHVISISRVGEGR